MDSRFRYALKIIVALVITVALGELWARYHLTAMEGSSFLGNRLDRAQPSAKTVPVQIEGADSAWYTSSPLPLDQVLDIAHQFPDLHRLANDPYVLARLGTNFPKVFNADHIRSAVCRNPEGNRFRDIPHPLFVFSLSSGAENPRFRYYPKARYPSGLVTNRFGYRSHDIQMDKPDGTIRVAFVGGSTVLGSPWLRYSTPELVGHWLQLWADSQGGKTRIEVINAGRGGFQNIYVKSVLESEISAFEPDIVVHYGFESFHFSDIIKLPDGIEYGSPFKEREEYLSQEWLNRLANNSELARKARGFLLEQRVPVIRGLVAEPPKPNYETRWPADIDDERPDPWAKDLPGNLGLAVVFVTQLIDAIKEMGAIPVLATSLYAAFDGMVIDADHAFRDPIRGRRYNGVYGYLNERSWPVSYRHQRQYLEFQARLFREIAKRKGTLFIEILSGNHVPARYFSDGVHMTDDGARLRAWLIFKKILPLVRDMIAEGRLPRSDMKPNDAHETFGEWPRRLELSAIDCRPRIEGATVVDGGADLRSITRAYGLAKVEVTDRVRIVTAPERNAYAASITLKPNSSCPGPGWVQIKARVNRGEMTVGLMDRGKTKFLKSIVIPKSGAPYLFSEFPSLRYKH